MRNRPDPMSRVAVLRRPAGAAEAGPARDAVLPANSARQAQTESADPGHGRAEPAVQEDDSPEKSGRHRQGPATCAVADEKISPIPPLGTIGGWVPDKREPWLRHGRPTSFDELPDQADEIEGPVEEGADDDGGIADEPAPPTGLPAPQPTVRARRIGRHWGRFAELWVPEPLRDARVDPGRRGALILLLVATLAATATAVGVWLDRPESRPVETAGITGLAATAEGSVLQLVDPAQTSGSPAGTSVSPAAPPTPTVPALPSEVIVSVTGLVAKPGLVTLPAGARVADAIAAAGGTAPDADLTGMNLAARLADGDSVVIGGSAGAAGATPGVASAGAGAGAGQGSNSAAAGPATGPAGSELINLNTADEAGLDTLPGVGPVMAQNILAWRAANGSFTSIEQLQEISGIGPSRYAQIAPLVTVS